LKKVIMKPAIWTGMYPDYPLCEAFEILHKSGWRFFEISSEHIEAIELEQNRGALISKVQTCLRELAITAPQAHTYLEANIADPDESKRRSDIRRILNHIDIGIELGVRDFVIHPGEFKIDGTLDCDRSKELNIDSFRQISSYAEKSDIRICIENLPHKGATSSLELLDLIREIDRPGIGINFDTSHANMSGLDIPQTIMEMGTKLFSTHISDNNGSGDQHLTPGGGTIDWQAVMTAFREIDYRGLINLEIPGERHKTLDLRELKSGYSLKVTQWLITLGDENRISGNSL